VDRAARTVVLRVRGVALPACRVGRNVRDWARIRAGDEVRATIREMLTVYVQPANGSGGPPVAFPGLSQDARVLAADPSYRLLTVQYPDGETETFKIGLHVRTEGIGPGDSVAIRPVEAAGLHVRRHPDREESSHASARAGSPGP
jgi:hypothetical protein